MNVYVDKTKPKIVINAYKRAEGGGRYNDTVLGNKSNAGLTLGWYGIDHPNGVRYEFSLTSSPF